MSRMKLVVLSLLAAFALSAVASSTASAHEWLVNGKAIAAGEKVEINGNQIPGNNQLEGVIAKLSIHITCQEVLAPPAGNTIEEKGKFKIKLEYKACTVYALESEAMGNEPKCKVAAFNAEGSGELTAAGIMTVSGAPFATIKIENSETETCLLDGEFKVETTQVCSLPHYAVAAWVAVIECNPAGSEKLKLGTEPAKLYSVVGVSGTKGQKLSSN
jgi:hypothetical protein